MRTLKNQIDSPAETKANPWQAPELKLIADTNIETKFGVGGITDNGTSMGSMTASV